MNIIVLGSHGMAGHVIVRYLREIGYNITTVARSNADICLDIEDFEQVKNFYNNLDESYVAVINCMGLLVQDSNERPDRAVLINSWFPKYSEYRLKNRYTKFIHLSTDCVFNGSKGYYHEDAVHDETNSYGKSKSLGEISNNKDLTLRMSIIGPEIKLNGTGLFHWLCNNNNKEVPGWTNALWNGVTTLQLAKCIDQHLKSNCNITGVYHLVNNHVQTNKYDLLCMINNIFDLNKKIVAAQGPKNINKILVDTRNLKFFTIPNYIEQLTELKLFIDRAKPKNS